MDGKTEDNNINLGKFLPLGAVVLLKNATKRVMITGFCSIRKDDPNDKKIYDYIAFSNISEPHASYYIQ